MTQEPSEETVKLTIKQRMVGDDLPLKVTLEQTIVERRLEMIVKLREVEREKTEEALSSVRNHRVSPPDES